MEKVIDKIDNKEAYFHGFVDGFSLRIENGKEYFLIQVWDLHNAKSKDKRGALMEINHVSYENSKINEHTITICLDMKNHKPDMPLHINVDWASKNINCPYCKSKLIEDFPKGLNHMPVYEKIIKEEGEEYKIMDIDKTIDNILLHLKSKDVFSDFPVHHTPMPIDSTDYKACQMRISKLLG